MTVYTMTLDEVIEHYDITTTLDDYTGITNISVEDAKLLGLGYFPIFDNDYRAPLMGKIIDHFRNREIGYESLGTWRLGMRRKLNEIMPYYNQLYLSTQISFDPLATVNLHTVIANTQTQAITNATTSHSANETANASRSVTSATPQTMLSGNGDYATGAADVNGTGTGTADATDNTTSNTDAGGNGTTDITGFQGIASALLMQYRESLVNIDLSVIRELEEMFMGVWDNGDSFTNNNHLTGWIV